MSEYVELAKTIENDLIDYRRNLHALAEVGTILPNTTEYVRKQLQEIGYDVKYVGIGLTCCAGKGDKTVLLRSDMDALPQEEHTNLPFSCKTHACHSCGHDFHMAMLLGAAKLIKKREKQLNGCIKFMFQPGEEGFNGAEEMCRAGVLNDPKVDKAFALHVIAGDSSYDVSTGLLSCFEDKALQSADTFKITIKGKSSHGALPDCGISALTAGAEIVSALNHIGSMELPSTCGAVITICKFTSGVVANIIPDEAILEGTARAYRYEDRAFIKQRMETICHNIGNAFRTEVELEFVGEIPPLINDYELSQKTTEISREIIGTENVQIVPPDIGSDDFAFISEKVPAVYAMLGAGSKAQGYEYGLHDPRVIIDEKALPIGTALFVGWAEKMLCEE